jgi:hypothetical protein
MLVVGSAKAFFSTVSSAASTDSAETEGLKASASLMVLKTCGAEGGGGGGGGVFPLL